MSQPPIRFEEWIDCLELNNPENSYTKQLVLQAYKMGYQVGFYKGLEEGKTNGIKESFEMITKQFSKYIK
jgi:hypothetical protein